MLRAIVVGMMVLFSGAAAIAEDGPMTVSSRDGYQETVKRLEASIASHGMMLFARVDHAAGAKAVGLELRPTELFVFGSPKGGTPLMQMRQTVGIDLPMKALVWQDAAGKIFVTYNDPSWIASRHTLPEGAKGGVDKIRTLLAAIAGEAAGAK